MLKGINDIIIEKLHEKKGYELRQCNICVSYYITTFNIFYLYMCRGI